MVNYCSFMVSYGMSMVDYIKDDKGLNEVSFIALG